ncbi:rhodanese-like domain-containing protein [Flavobacterium sp. RNTU_13]|uniref:rhodanese-like domain-containing protein n=1 Tax=Flavobacterium sp. RNTU_13 TaxID=3375145 RepID=UPI0039868DB7
MFGLLKNLFGNNKPTEIQPNAFIVDVRSPGEFASGSVKGAVNIPLDNLRSQLARFKSKEQVVVFCRSGMRSAQAKSILESSGIQNVVNAGGLGQAQALLSQ